MTVQNPFKELLNPVSQIF